MNTNNMMSSFVIVIIVCLIVGEGLIKEELSVHTWELFPCKPQTHTNLDKKHQFHGNIPSSYWDISVYLRLRNNIGISYQFNRMNGIFFVSTIFLRLKMVIQSLLWLFCHDDNVNLSVTTTANITAVIIIMMFTFITFVIIICVNVLYWCYIW